MIRWGDPPRVLIVDDSEEQVRFLRRVLTADGYRCLSTAHGNDVFDTCLDGTMDIVLMDVNMPEVDGLTICRRLKAASETCLIPVLIMTGLTDRTSHLAAL